MRNFEKNHDKFEARLVDELGLGVIGAEVERLPNTTSVWVPALKDGRWVETLSERGFAVSAGAACLQGPRGPVEFTSSLVRLTSGWRCYGFRPGLKPVKKHLMPSVPR